MSNQEIKKPLYDADPIVNEYIAGWLDGWREQEDVKEVKGNEGNYR